MVPLHSLVGAKHPSHPQPLLSSTNGGQSRTQVQKKATLVADQPQPQPWTHQFPQDKAVELLPNSKLTKEGPRVDHENFEGSRHVGTRQ